MSGLVLVVFGAVYLGMAIGRWPGLKVDRTGIALLGAIVLYGVLGLTVLPSGAEELGAQAGGAELGQDLLELTDAVETLWYALIIAIGLIYQGGMARAFLRRREAVTRYLAEVPDWARKVIESMD